MRTNPGTVSHICATLVLASENLSHESEMIYPSKASKNIYRKERLKILARLAWDIVEAVEDEGIERGHLKNL